MRDRDAKRSRSNKFQISPAILLVIFDQAQAEYTKHKALFEHARSLDDAVFVVNAEADMKASKLELDAL